MKNLYFANYYNELIGIKKDCKEEEIYKEVAEFLKKYNYKNYYVRTWMENDELWIDFGSHVEFFVWK